MAENKIILGSVNIKDNVYNCQMLVSTKYKIMSYEKILIEKLDIFDIEKANMKEKNNNIIILDLKRGTKFDSEEIFQIEFVIR